MHTALDFVVNPWKDTISSSTMRPAMEAGDWAVTISTLTRPEMQWGLTGGLAFLSGPWRPASQSSSTGSSEH